MVGAIMLTLGALTVGTAAAVKFRLRRRADTTAGVAAVGMAAVGMVAGKAIEYQACTGLCARLDVAFGPIASL
jgi:hypothetical protein